MNKHRSSLSSRRGGALLVLACGFVLILSGCSNPASSSSGTSKSWTWVAGSSSINQAGDYPDAVGGTGIPGGRNATTSCIDSSGNLWLFGGQGFASSSSTGYLNDLWKYDGTNWTWVAGSSSTDQAGTYTSTGSTCTPGGRSRAASCYDSTNNCFWLFGGQGYGASSSGYLNDLWKYDIDAGTWTWVAGTSYVNQTGTYTSIGGTGTPGGRYDTVGYYDSKNNCFWLFGGHGYDSSSEGALNDLWKYDIDAETWTWVAGKNSVNQTGTYTSIGGTGTPGSRYRASACSDSDGNLWLFGGIGYSAASSGSLNDLWKYDTSASSWTWVAGSSSVNQAGTYPSAVGETGTPGARRDTSIFSNSDGNLRLFGGYGYGASSSGYLNDLWKYDTSAGTWTWVAGSNSVNQTGTYTSTGSTGTPGARCDVFACSDSDGNFWLFGGEGLASSSSTYGYLNDLWKYGD